MDIPRPISRQPMPDTARKVFTGEIFDIYQWEQVQFDGTTRIFEKAKRDDTVAVIATTADKKIMLIEDEQPARGTVLTFPGGRIDPGEDAFTAAKRELLEETGFESADWELWKAYQPVTKLDWAMYLFVARNCKEASDIKLDAGERITLLPVSLDDAIRMVDEERFEGDMTRYEFVRAGFDPERRAMLEVLFFGK